MDSIKLMMRVENPDERAWNMKEAVEQGFN